jgi:hypothetical protein
MKQLLLILITLVPVALNAQQTTKAVPGPGEFVYDNVGRPVFLRSDIDIQGSQYFEDKYCHATLKVRKGKTYHGLKVKIDLMSNGVIYVDDSGKELEAVTPLDRIEFYDCADPSKNKVLISGLPPVDKLDESSLYIVLDSGNVSLLKHIKVVVTDKRNNYGNANIVRTIQQYDEYYSYAPGKGLARLEKDNGAVLNALNTKKAEISSYIVKNEIKFRKEADLVKVFSYYNSLK